MALFGRRPPPEPGTVLSHLMAEGRDGLNAGALVRALARSVVHVPLPGAPAEPRPRVDSSRDGGEGPPLYVVADERGEHALLFSTARRLVESFGAGTSAASLPFAALAVSWPDGVDLVLDAGHPAALEVSLPVLRHVLLEVAGVPTGTSLQPSPGDRSQVPTPELTQLIGATRAVAAGLPEVQALSRAETFAAVPAPRPVIDLVVDLDAVSDARLQEVMTALSHAAAAVEPRPLRLTAAVDGTPSSRSATAEAVRSVDEPYYRRSD